MTNTVCAHYIVDRLDDILNRISEDINMNPDVDVFCDVGVEDLRWELVHTMGMNVHAAWKEENNA